MLNKKLSRPLAITMWDFSWLERRWPGAGYENWELILDELKERGYDAVRIDAYPHLIAADGKGTWQLKPEWNQQMWGAPSLIEVSNVEENLLEFLRCCKKKGILVGLSTWFREDLDQIRLRITTPHELAKVWMKTLEVIDTENLLDCILYVDVSNEYPHPAWTPYLVEASGIKAPSRFQDESIRWMKESLAELREAFPNIDYTFSELSIDDESIARNPMTSEHYELTKKETDFLDFVEMHIWFTNFRIFMKRSGIILIDLKRTVMKIW